MPGENSLETEDKPLVDMDEAIRDISSDLFPTDQEPGSEADPGAGKEVSSEASAVETPSPLSEKTETKEPVSSENSAEVQAIGAPKTWTKEAIAKWATIDPLIQQEIAKREEDMFRGIEKYKGAAELGARYHAVTEPYQAALAAEGVDPVELFKNFAGNHYLLSRGTPEQKTQLAANLLTAYNIDLEAVLQVMGNAAIHRPDPNVLALQREIAELKNGITTNQQREYAARHNAAFEEINKFADDSAHPYFDEVANDIAGLINAGLATSLEEAYQKAIFANPATRQKELDRLATEKVAAIEAEAKTREEKRRKSMGEHVEVTSRSKNGTVPVGSMDDTLEETMRAIQARG